MARYIGPSCAQCRREGEKLFLKGARCYTAKCAMVKRPYAPGRSPTARAGKMSEYGTQLREKQKAKRLYGLLEAQFRKIYEIASLREGITGDMMLELLERRLDNVVYRNGLADSRKQARQFVSHGHIEVNGTLVNISSYQVRPGDIVRLRPTLETAEPWKERIEGLKNKHLPGWMKKTDTATWSIMSLPTRADVEQSLNMQLIVEFYSR